VDNEWGGVIKMFEFLYKYYTTLAMTSIVPFLIWIIRLTKSRIKHEKEERAAALKKAEEEKAEQAERDRIRDEALQNLLRNAIIAVYNRSIDKKYIAIYERDSLEKVYVSYHDLGGNGTITHLIEVLRLLPTQQVDIPSMENIIVSNKA